MKIWKTMDWECCPECGGGAEVLTACKEDDVFCDGDEARCVECGLPGGVSDVDTVYIHWLSEDGDEQ